MATHALVARVLVVRVKTLHLIAVARVGEVAAVERIVWVYLHGIVPLEHLTLPMRHLSIPDWSLVRRILLVGVLILALLIERLVSY